MSFTQKKYARKGEENMIKNIYDSFVLKGEIAYAVDENTIQTYHNGYLVCEKGKC